MAKTKKKAGKRGATEHVLRTVPVSKCRTLKRNPQLLTRAQMESLKRSIELDGFVAPILVRPRENGKWYEIVSGNHRFMAVVELGYKTVSAVVANLTVKQTQRLAVNLNLIHGDPPAVLLAPFLAEMDDDVLADIHLEDVLIDEIEAFDQSLSDSLSKLQNPGVTLDKAAGGGMGGRMCKCSECGKSHTRASAQ